MDQYSADLQKLINEDGVGVHRTPASVQQAQLEAWDKVMEQMTQDEFFKKVTDSYKAWSERVAFYALMNQADYKLAYEHYFPGKLGF
jgi:TRAP-type mannitol/chloroaromatic compound transport system substrate-binding protein